MSEYRIGRGKKLNARYTVVVPTALRAGAITSQHADIIDEAITRIAGGWKKKLILEHLEIQPTHIRMGLWWRLEGIEVGRVIGNVKTVTSRYIQQADPTCPKDAHGRYWALGYLLTTTPPGPALETEIQEYLGQGP